MIRTFIFENRNSLYKNKIIGFGRALSDSVFNTEIYD